MTKASKAIRRSRTDTKDARRERAEKRNEDWSKMSPQKQLADLDARLGNGVGAAKQRAKLQAKIESLLQKKVKVEQESPTSPQENKTKEVKERRTKKS
jgi:hypothetical protein